MSSNGPGRAAFIPVFTPASTEPGSPRASKKRADFEAAWAELLPAVPDGAFEEWQHDRAWRAEMKAKRARGEELASEIHRSLMRCVCDTVFDSWKPDESGPHRTHIYAALAAGKVRW